VLPWAAPRVRLFLSHQRKSLFYRKRAWRFIAPCPHALRLVSKRQWSGTLRHAPAKARARHKSRQSLEDRRAIRWPWRFDTPPKPPNTVPTGASFLEILLLVTRYGKPQWFSKFIGIGQHLECSPPVSPTSLKDISYSYLGKHLECSLGRHCNCYRGKHLECSL